MTKAEFRKEVHRTLQVFPSYRYGQAVFNTMWQLCPEKADAFRSTAIDPFYNDMRAEEFITACFPGEI